MNINPAEYVNATIDSVQNPDPDFGYFHGPIPNHSHGWVPPSVVALRIARGRPDYHPPVNQADNVNPNHPGVRISAITGGICMIEIEPGTGMMCGELIGDVGSLRRHIRTFHSGAMSSQNRTNISKVERLKGENAWKLFIRSLGWRNAQFIEEPLTGLADGLIYKFCTEIEALAVHNVAFRNQYGSVFHRHRFHDRQQTMNSANAGQQLTSIAPSMSQSPGFQAINTAQMASPYSVSATQPSTPSAFNARQTPTPTVVTARNTPTPTFVTDRDSPGPIAIDVEDLRSATSSLSSLSSLSSFLHTPGNSSAAALSRRQPENRDAFRNRSRANAQSPLGSRSIARPASTQQTASLQSASNAPSVASPLSSRPASTQQTASLQSASNAPSIASPLSSRPASTASRFSSRRALNPSVAPAQKRLRALSTVPAFSSPLASAQQTSSPQSAGLALSSTSAPAQQRLRAQPTGPAFGDPPLGMVFGQPASTIFSADAQPVPAIPAASTSRVLRSARASAQNPSLPSSTDVGSLYINDEGHVRMHGIPVSTNPAAAQPSKKRKHSFLNDKRIKARAEESALSAVKRLLKKRGTRTRAARQRVIDQLASPAARAVRQALQNSPVRSNLAASSQHQQNSEEEEDSDDEE